MIFSDIVSYHSRINVVMRQVRTAVIDPKQTFNFSLSPDFRSYRSSMWKPSKDAIQISENDKARSDFVKHLVQRDRALDTLTPKSASKIPKIIVQFWDDENIPIDVQECTETWNQLKSKEFKHVLFNDDSARRFIAESLHADNAKAFDRCYHPAMKSDYFRLCFIFYIGGFYVDVDDVYSGIDIEHLFSDQRLKLQPLCFDMDADGMVDSEKFIRNRSFSNSWIFYFNNSPIVAPPGNPIIEYSLRRATRLILGCDENDFPEIQSTTGPGNLTASVVAYLSSDKSYRQDQCLSVLSEWGTYARTIWPLSYRNDRRNWRLSNKKPYMPIKSIIEKAQI